MLFIVSQEERKYIECAIFNVGGGTYSYRYGLAILGGFQRQVQ